MHRLFAGLFLFAALVTLAAPSSLESQAQAQRVLASAVEAIGGEAALRGLRSVRRGLEVQRKYQKEKP